MNIEFLKTAPPFRDLFPINEKVLDRVYWDMQKNGYDRSQPIVVWEGHDTTVIDGHTRLRAARKAKIFDVPVMPKAFSDENEALQYAIRCQRNRRNLKDFEIMKCMEELDKRMPLINNLLPKPSRAQDCALGKSAQKTASLLGVSTRKIEQTRTVMDRAPEDVKTAVQSGKMSINAAYNRTVNRNKPKSEIVPLTKEEQDALAEILKFAENRLSERLFDEFSLVLTKILTRHGNEV
ncbi:MAG: ParB N-terminal domain-containing protein [Victivallaceae bacterium]|nr:ParB N-terminal domain-containing protein [Victivallaceae bacterium]